MRLDRLGSIRVSITLNLALILLLLEKHGRLLQDQRLRSIISRHSREVRDRIHWRIHGHHLWRRRLLIIHLCGLHSIVTRRWRPHHLHWHPLRHLLLLILVHLLILLLLDAWVVAALCIVQCERLNFPWHVDWRFLVPVYGYNWLFHKFGRDLLLLDASIVVRGTQTQSPSLSSPVR